MLIEIIATNLEEAITAEKYGANRIELIHSFDLGGLSPALELSREVCLKVKIPVNVMIRPHGDSFCYSPADMKQIMLELEYLRDKTQANALVFGALDNNRNIDITLLKQIIANKGHLGFTFHRAIDVAANTLEAYNQLLEFKEIDLVLTSGGKNTAIEGARVIKQMLELNNGQSNCKILAGSGITPENAAKLIQQTNVTQIHLGTGVREDNILIKSKFDALITNIS